MFAKEITVIMPTAKITVQMCACGSKAVRYDTTFNVNACKEVTISPPIFYIILACV